MSESLCVRLFKLAAKSNLEIRLNFIPTTTGPLVVLKVSEVPEWGDSISDRLAVEYAVPMYDAKLLTHLSDDQIVERFEDLIKQIKKAKDEKRMKSRVYKPKRDVFIDFPTKHCKSCMFASGCPNKNVDKDGACYKYRPKWKGARN